MNYLDEVRKTRKENPEGIQQRPKETTILRLPSEKTIYEKNRRVIDLAFSDS